MLLAVIALSFPCVIADKGFPRSVSPGFCDNSYPALHWLFPCCLPCSSSACYTDSQCARPCLNCVLVPWQP